MVVVRICKVKIAVRNVKSTHDKMTKFNVTLSHDKMTVFNVRLNHDKMTVSNVKFNHDKMTLFNVTLNHDEFSLWGLKFRATICFFRNTHKGIEFHTTSFLLLLLNFAVLTKSLHSKSGSCSDSMIIAQKHSHVIFIFVRSLDLPLLFHVQ